MPRSTTSYLFLSKITVEATNLKLNEGSILISLEDGEGSWLTLGYCLLIIVAVQWFFRNRHFGRKKTLGVWKMNNVFCQ